MSGFLGGQIAMTVLFSKSGLNVIKEYLLDYIKSNPPKNKNENNKKLDDKNNDNEFNLKNNNIKNKENNTNVNNIKIYNDLNNESDIYSNSNNQDVKSNKLLLNIPHFEITVSSINKSLNESFLYKSKMCCKIKLHNIKG
jgi:hypothetical protein